MSLNGKQKSKNLTEGICRSKSFTGLYHRHASFSDVSFSSFDLNFNTCASTELHNSLGTAFKHGFSLNSAKNFIQALSKSSKNYAFPQPHNTQIFCDATVKGLKDSILFVQNDISATRATFDNVSVSSVMSQGKLYELEKQMKANERLLKKLEFHLSKVEELKEKYIIQNRMREGIRTMAYAYILSPGKEKEIALQNVKAQFKECSDFLCSLESTLESMMGTFLFEMKGVQGFARICHGDIFEVVIKHGDQKWRSRGRVLKNGEQVWENKFMLFKALFCQLLYIKAVEVRGLGKNIILGNKFCEIHDLFCAQPQQMTMNLNASGSLKLNLIITWNPLRSIEEGIQGASPSSLSGVPHIFSHYNTSQSYIEDIKHFSELALGKDRFNYSETTSQSITEGADTSISGQSSSSTASPDSEMISSSCATAKSSILNHDFYPELTSSLKEPVGVNCNDLNVVSCVISNEYNLTCIEDSSHASSASNTEDINLTSVLKKLLHLLAEVIEQYPVMLELLNIVEGIEQLLKKKYEGDSDSVISISVESALGCFDFLNTAIDMSDFDSNDKLSEDSMNASDNNVNLHTSVDDRVQEPNSTYNQYSSGNDEIDTVLTDHLFHCVKLISNLASSGSVKDVSRYFLVKLKNQQTCLSVLQNILKINNVYEIDDFFDEKEEEIKELWNSVAGNALYCTVSHMSTKMKSVISSKVALDKYMASIVCSRLILTMLDSDSFLPSSCISILQFKLFFTRYNNPYNVIRDIAADSIANH